MLQDKKLDFYIGGDFVNDFYFNENKTIAKYVEKYCFTKEELEEFILSLIGQLENEGSNYYASTRNGFRRDVAYNAKKEGLNIKLHD